MQLHGHCVSTLQDPANELLRTYELQAAGTNDHPFASHAVMAASIQRWAVCWAFVVACKQE
jgi:hypothetical protein